jgi:tRNA(Ile)-lysidine synthase
MAMRPAPNTDAGGVAAESFAVAMDALGPFEPEPLIAVAVSGGPDSMALALLLDRWVRSRAGAVIAFTVDHGLRPESAFEARQVGAWLTGRGIAHETLEWAGAKPRSGIQSAARDARYGLLTDACARRGVLHLAVGHHADDQAETVLFRRDRGSGDDGVAGMASTRSLGAARLIRPLLAWPKTALTATCAAFGQGFLVDPSNSSQSFARAGLRRRLSADAALMPTLLAIAYEAAQRRADRADRLAALLGRIAEARPDGAIVLDSAGLAAAEPDLRRASLAAALRVAGGGAYAPAADALDRLTTLLAGTAFAGASLAGCLVRRWRHDVLVCRELGRAAPASPLPVAQWTRWDGRFSLLVAGPVAADPTLTVGALGRAEYAALRRGLAEPPPAIIGAVLPAIRAGGAVIAVPGLGWSKDGAPAVEQRLQPLWSLAPERFTVVYAGHDIIFDDGGQGSRVVSRPVRGFGVSAPSD